MDNATLTTDVVSNSPSKLSPLVPLCLGIAMLEMGRVFVEQGIEQIANGSGNRNLLKASGRKPLDAPPSVPD